MTVELKGLDELRRKLRGIPADLEKKGFRSAMRKAANIVRDAAVANANAIDEPETKENIAKNITVKFSPRAYKRNKDIMFRIGVLGGAKESKAADPTKKGGNTTHWRYVELGTSKVKSRAFMLPALRESAGKVLDESVTEISLAIDKAVAKQT